MRAQNFLGDKNSNLRLSDQFWATKDVTYIYVSTSELRDSFHSLLKSQDSRWLQKEIKSSWDGKVANKKTRLQDQFCQKFKSLGHEELFRKNRLRDAYNSAEILRDPNFW